MKAATASTTALLPALLCICCCAATSGIASPSPKPLSSNPGGPVPLLPSPPLPVPLTCISPSPWLSSHPKINSYHDGLLEFCVEISAYTMAAPFLGLTGSKALDLAAVELSVATKCVHAVKYVSFGGKQYTPKLTNYQDACYGVKIYPHYSYDQLAQHSVQLCIRLADPCSDASTVFDMIAFYGSYPTRYGPPNDPLCAITPLYCPDTFPTSQPPILPPIVISPFPTSPPSLLPPVAASPFPYPPQPNCPNTASPGYPEMCNGTIVPMRCGSDKPGCDLTQLVTPSASPSGTTGTVVQVGSEYTVGDCCKQCSESSTCNSFEVRGGVCYHKSYRLEEYPASVSGLCCPSDYSYYTYMKDVGSGETIIGSRCSF